MNDYDYIDLDENQVHLYPVLKDGKWGCIDQNGELVVKPNYGVISNFRDGFASVHERISDYLDAYDSNILESIFENLHIKNDLVESSKTNAFGFIDKSGSVVIPPQFRKVKYFSEGLAPVQIKDKWGYINKNGWIEIPPEYTHANPFHEGLAEVWNGMFCGFINKSGELITEMKFNEARHFVNGLAPVRFGTRQSGRWGFINKLGDLVIKPKYMRADIFSEGLAAVKVESWFDNLWGFIDTSGNMIIKPQFDDVLPFSENLARVLIKPKLNFLLQWTARPQDALFKKSNWSYVDKNGNLVLKMKFDDAGSFHDGLTAVSCVDKSSYGKIDKLDAFAKHVTETQHFGYKWGYANKTGELVIPTKFDAAYEFSNGVAKVTVENKIGYINKSGSYVWEPTN